MAKEKDKSMVSIRVVEPVLLNDGEFVLDISHTEFNKNPKKVYEVPNTQFWLSRIGDPPKILRHSEPAPKAAKPEGSGADEK